MATFQWPELYVCHEFGRTIALNVAACECAFLDEVGEAIVSLRDRAGSREAVLSALAPRFSRSRVAAGLRRLEEQRILASEPAPLAQERYGAPDSAAVTLNLAEACNLRCRYCYVEERKRASAALMSRATARRAVDFAIEHFADAKRISFSFYGGEPLLNAPVLRDVMCFANRRLQEVGLPEPDYHLSTNGTRLDPSMVEFLATQQVTVLVSLDGRPAVHDALRVDARGNGTHARVLDGIQRLRAAGGRCRVSASAVITRGRRLLDTYRYLTQLGLHDLKISFMRYVDDSLFALDRDAKQQYAADLRELAQDCVRRLLRGRRPAYYEFHRRLLHLWTRTRRKTFCPAGRTRLGVSPRGDLYPCGPAACMGDSRLGQLDSGLDRDAVDSFLARNQITSSPACRVCWARFLCGGGCPLPLVKGSQENCEITRETTRLALYIYLRVREENEMLLTSLVDESFLARVRGLAAAAKQEVRA